MSAMVPAKGRPPTMGTQRGQDEEGPGVEADHGEHHQGRDHREGRGEHEHQAVGLGRNGVLLGEELQGIGDEEGETSEDREEGHPAQGPHARLVSAGEAVQAPGNAGGTQAQLHVAQHLALGEGGERHQREDEDEHRDALEKGHDKGLEQGHLGHRSISPSTTSRVPMAAMMSATSPPSTIFGRAWRFAKPGARTWKRYGLRPPFSLTR